MYGIINKAVITLIPKKPFIEWARSTDAQAAFIEEESILSASTAYLVDDSEDGDEPEKLLRKNCKVIFEEELSSWYMDESTWPPKRDLKTFRQWFDARVHSVVIDIGKHAPITDEF